MYVCIIVYPICLLNHIMYCILCSIYRLHNKSYYTIIQYFILYHIISYHIISYYCMCIYICIQTFWNINIHIHAYHVLFVSCEVDGPYRMMWQPGVPMTVPTVPTVPMLKGLGLHRTFEVLFLRVHHGYHCCQLLPAVADANNGKRSMGSARK